MYRREFIEKLAAATGAVVLLPTVTACKKKDAETETPAPKSETAPAPKTEDERMPKERTEPSAPPTAKPADWDPIVYNRERGNAGAIPASYQDDINGPDGVAKHLGKHLPYQPKVEAALIPGGFIAIMWGDPDKGHAKHPNAVPGPDNNGEGHWYNWIRIRKAADGEAEELESGYSSWPTAKDGDRGQFAALGGGDITADSGKNTIYLCALPEGLGAGDTVRIWAHCLTHGEYVDFLTLA